MFESLHSALRMDGLQLHNKNIHIVEEEDHLGSFIISHFIHWSILRQSPTVLIGFESTFGHYNGIGYVQFTCIKAKVCTRLLFFSLV